MTKHYTPTNIRNRICYQKHRSYINKYNSQQYLIPEDVLQQIESEAITIERWINEEKHKFYRIEDYYDQLSLEFGDIEVVKNGFVKIDPFKQVYIGEKGVEIALAVKMISLSVENQCDKIILISGDYDYAEAIKYVKNKMTKIHLVKIQKGFPPKNKSVSRELAILADKVIDIYESDIRKNFLKNQRVTT